MKGIILAGGLGTRLRPVTYVVNKNLLPIYNKPSIFYSLNLLKQAGITDIAIIAEHNYIEDFKLILGGGADFGVNLHYYNDSPLKKGPVSALLHAKSFANNQRTCVVFADNVFDITIKDQVNNFTEGAHFFLKEVNNPSSFGVAQFDKNNKLITIEEKPKNPKTNFASIGLYLFDEDLFKFLQKVKPSKNGEYLMPSLIKYYIKYKELGYTIIKGFWQDIGTFDGMYKASEYFYKKEKALIKNKVYKKVKNIKL